MDFYHFGKVQLLQSFVICATDHFCFVNAGFRFSSWSHNISSLELFLYFKEVFGNLFLLRMFISFKNIINKHNFNNKLYFFLWKKVCNIHDRIQSPFDFINFRVYSKWRPGRRAKRGGTTCLIRPGCAVLIFVQCWSRHWNCMYCLVLFLRKKHFSFFPRFCELLIIFEQNKF